MEKTTQGATASSYGDEELSSLLGRGNATFEHLDPLSLEADCFPLDGVIDAAHASARARSGALRSRSADLAREVLARAELEVRDVMAKDPLAADWADRSGEIVARAQRQVAEILAQGRNNAEVLELRAGQRAADLRAEGDSLADAHIDSDDSDRAASSALVRPEPGRWQQQSEPATLPDADYQGPERLPIGLPRADSDRPLARAADNVLVSAHAIVEAGSSTAPTDQCFATLRALPLPSEKGGLRYRLSGRLTLATMLALQQAVSRLPGVNSANLDPEPDDVAVLSMTTNDSTLVQRLLGSMPAFHLQVDSA
jgi:hypothetical protein